MIEKNKIAVLFPGQGSQYVGMGKEFLDADPEAEQLMATAEEISGLPLKRLCLEGPMEELTRTAFLQPAMTVINLICWQALQKAGITPDFVAGHSLGEYAALAAARVLDVKDTMGLVTERGRLMEREADKNPGSMRAILGLEINEVQEILRGLTAGTRVTAANHNSEKQIVISGEIAGLDEAGEVVAARGGKAIALKVSGAWHSELVREAVPDFTRAMAKANFKKPSTPIFFNVTAAPESDPDAIRQTMALQIASTVRWYESMIKMIEAGVTTFIEVGPKTVLSGLMKKIVPAGFVYKALQVDSPATLEKCLGEIAKS